MVTLRRAGLRDAYRLYRWRRDPLTASMMLGAPPESFVAHLDWMDRVSADRSVGLFVAVAGRPHFAELFAEHVGTGRINLRGQIAEFSVTVAPNYRRRGYASAIVEKLVDEAQKLGARHCVAWVRPENAASIAAFRRAGFGEPRVRRGLGLVVMGRACD